MIRFLLRRILWIVPTLWVIATISFFMIRLAPGGPFQAERDIPKSAHEALAAKYGLNLPPLEQYRRFLWNAAHLDFGPSYSHPALKVQEMIFRTFPVSLELGAAALVLALLLGMGLGAIAAVRKNRLPDYLAMSGALVGISVPNFVLGPLLVLAFSLQLYWLPPGQWGDLPHAILPVVTLAGVYVAYVARLTRGGLVEVLGQDFIRTARAKGLSEGQVLGRHALRLGILPLVTFLGPATAGIVTGSVVVESVFAVPGLGRQIYTAAINRDYTLVLGTVLFYSAFLLVLNLVVDLAYARLDPRVELE